MMMKRLVIVLLAAIALLSGAGPGWAAPARLAIDVSGNQSITESSFVKP